MSGNWKAGLMLLASGLVLVLAIVFSQTRPAVGAAEKDGVNGPRHTVVATDGTHLVVTDNQEAKVYFYAIERDGKPGDELKMRGTIDLKGVGKPTIKPTKEN